VQYSYIIGLFANMNLETMQWVYLSLVVILVMIGISSVSAFGTQAPKKKTLTTLVYLVFWLFIGGIVGIVIATLMHFVTYAFVSDFRKDYL